MPSRTLRSAQTRASARAGPKRDSSTGTFVRGGDHVDVAMLAHPGSAVPRSDLLQPAYRLAHPALVMDEEASLPSTTSSRAAPSGNAITGVPQASASTITIPNGSFQRIGIRRPRARANSERFADPPTSPTKWTRSPSMWGAISRSKKAADRAGSRRPRADVNGARGCDRAMRSLLRGHSPDRQKVVALSLLQRPVPQIDRVGDRGDRPQPGRSR